MIIVQTLVATTLAVLLIQIVLAHTLTTALTLATTIHFKLREPIRTKRTLALMARTVEKFLSLTKTLLGYIMPDLFSWTVTLARVWV